LSPFSGQRPPRQSDGRSLPGRSRHLDDHELAKRAKPQGIAEKVALIRLDTVPADLHLAEQDLVRLPPCKYIKEPRQSAAVHVFHRVEDIRSPMRRTRGSDCPERRRREPLPVQLVVESRHPQPMPGCQRQFADKSELRAKPGCRLRSPSACVAIPRARQAALRRGPTTQASTAGQRLQHASQMALAGPSADAQQ